MILAHRAVEGPDYAIRDATHAGKVVAIVKKLELSKVVPGQICLTAVSLEAPRLNDKQPITDLTLHNEMLTCYAPHFVKSSDLRICEHATTDK